MIKSGDEPIPGYRVETLLGRGQFGEVWRARSPGNAVVALKVLELSGAHGWKEFRAIQRVKQIRHVHLMPIVAIWLLDEHRQVLRDDVMESIASSRETLGGDAEGDTLIARPVEQALKPVQLIIATLVADQSLCDRLRECQAEGLNGIPVDELLRYMHDAAKGLDFLNSSQHKIGDSVGAVQHCDVKPDNLMLTGGSVVIADFGVAQTLAHARLDATATSLGGTPAYMPPELFANKPARTTDQYSLAVTYYELRTARLPFVDQTYAAVFLAHQQGTLDFSKCKPKEQEVLRRATSPNPEQRFASCAEFVDALDASVRHAPSDSSPRPRSRGRGLSTAALGCVAAAAAVGYGAFWWLSRDPPVPQGRFTLVVDPPDATVTIDGAPVDVNSQGEIVVERPIGDTFTVKASRPPDRREREMKFESPAGNERREITLQFAAEHFANEAERLFQKDLVSDAAIAALAAAIKDSPAKYARLPTPLERLAGLAPIVRLQLADGGRNLIIASRDGTIRRLEIEKDGPAESSAIVHGNNGELQSLAATDGWTASIADADRGIALTPARGERIQLTVPKESGDVKGIAIANNGRTLLAVSELLRLVVPVSRSWTLHAWKLDAANVAASRETLAEKNDEMEPLLAAAHGKSWAVVASTSDDGWVVRQFSLAGNGEGQLIHKQSGEIKAIAISQDDRLIALGGGAVSAEGDLADFNATLIDVQSGRDQVLRRGHGDSISAIAFDESGATLATADIDGEAQAWTIPAAWDGARPPSGEPIFLRGIAAAISAIACPRTGWVLCCVGGEAALWDCQPGHPQSITLSAGATEVTSLTATADGHWIVTGHDDGTLRFWNLPRVILLIRACEAAGVPVGTSETGDQQARRYDQPFPPSRRSRAETAEIVSRL